jgi:hypothetical protein
MVPGRWYPGSPAVWIRSNPCSSGMNGYSFVLCRKTVREHAMVPFLVVIVKTFVHG